MAGTETMINFLKREKYITLTSIGSIITFAFISSLKRDMIDPILLFIMPEEFFGFIDITIRDGIIPIEVKLGSFFREFMAWIFSLSILYVLSKFAFPDVREGNYDGVAVV